MKRIALIVLFLLLVTGCGTRFYYSQLDWLIPFFLRDYISLNSEQKTILKERLLKQIDWHCKTQLADYSGALRSLSKDISNTDHPIDYDRLNDYYAKFRGFWTELIRQVAPDIAEILRTATDAQIEELFENLDERNDELRAEYIDLPPEERMKEREERMVKGLRKWLSMVAVQGQGSRRGHKSARTEKRASRFRPKIGRNPDPSGTDEIISLSGKI